MYLNWRPCLTTCLFTVCLYIKHVLHNPGCHRNVARANWVKRFKYRRGWHKPSGLIVVKELYHDRWKISCCSELTYFHLRVTWCLTLCDCCIFILMFLFLHWTSLQFREENKCWVNANCRHLVWEKICGRLILWDICDCSYVILKLWVFTCCYSSLRSVRIISEGFRAWKTAPDRMYEQDCLLSSCLLCLLRDKKAMKLK